jgi:hypothetical protein
VIQDIATRKSHVAKPKDIFSYQTKTNSPPNNGAIFTNTTIIKAVIALAAEAKLGALYLNAKEVVYLHQILIEMGHLQPQTPIQTDNTWQKE